MIALPPFTGHRAATWRKGEGGSTHDIFSPVCPESFYDDMMRWTVSKGANAVCGYVANGGDGSFHFNLYRNGIGRQLDVDKAAAFVARVRAAWEVYGCAFIPWLHSDDDHMGNNVADLTRQQNYHAQALALVAPWTIGVCGGLEVDEYWSKDFTGKIIRHLGALTDKKVGVHMTNIRKLDWIPTGGPNGGYGIFAQYGISTRVADGVTKTPAEIEAMTRTAKKTLGPTRWIVGTEYALDVSDRALLLGDAAMRGGAIATQEGRH